jgi:hypothetical protein
MVRPNPVGMSPLVVRCFGIYQRPPEFPDLVVIWGWSRPEEAPLVEEKMYVVDSVDSARWAVKRLLGPSARKVACYDPAPIEVWGVTVDPCH